MAAVYDEFGNFIYDDPNIPTPISEPDVDSMRYELAKAGSMPLRPGGSDVPYLASQVPTIRIPKTPPEPARPYSTATNVPQAIADRLGLSAIPQAALGMISSFPAAVAKETGFPDVAEAIQYTPTSKMGSEVLEGVSRLPQVVTGSEMGVGPLAEFYVPRRGFGLQSRPLLSPDDVRVMGGRAIESGRELRNVPEDFRAAQEGLRRESVFGGPTLGARTQGLFDEIGDVMARREMQGLSPIPGIPDIVSPDTRMYAVRPANVGQMIDPTDLPTARYSDQNRKINTVSNMLDDVVPTTDFDYPHNNSTEYYNAAVRDAPSDMTEAWKTFSQKKYNEMFPDAPNDAAAVEAFGNRFDQRSFALTNIEMLSEFARSPEALSAVEAIANRRDEMINEYNEAKNKPKEKKPKNDDELAAYKERQRAHEENVEKLEVSILKENLMPELSRKEFIERITPPTKEEYMRRAQAAADYIQGTFKKDISKYIGTSQGPQMELAKRGITMAPKQELLEKLKQFQSDRGAYSGELKELEKERAKAGFNPKGEMYPLIVKTETEVKDLQTQLNDLNRQKSELRDLHRVEMPDEPDPAKNPTETGAKYRALTNPMNALIDKIEQSKKQLENFKLANAYEMVSDIAYTPVFAKTFKQNIPYSEKQFFPNIEKTPDEAQMFNVKQRELGDLGIPFLAEMIVKNIMTGRIPLINDKPEALPKSKYKEDLSNFSEEDIYDYANAIKNSKAALGAKEEAEAAVMSGANNKFIVYEGKRVAGAAAYDVDESAKTVFIDHIGSLIKGTGKQMVQEIENVVPSGYRVVLTPSDKSKGFWNKLGYKPTGEGNLLEKRIEDASDQKTSKPKLDIQIDKIIEQLTKPRLKEESMEEVEKRKGMTKINDYAQETLSKIPPDLRFKNSSVLELTKQSPEDSIRRQISFDGMVLDHCIAGCDAPHPGINPFSGERYNYSYPVDPATGKDRGDRKLASSFMKNVLKGDQRTAHVRDNISGLPVVTINMLKDNSGKYNLSYVSGYQNKAEPESVANYAADVKDYLNLRSDVISGSGDALSKWGIIDTKNSESQRKISSMMNINSSNIPSLGLPRFVLESDLRNLALAQPMGDTHADMVRRRSQLNDEYNRLSRERGEEDPEVQDLGSQIADLTARLQSMSRQVATQGSPNLFRRMTTEALTNGIGMEDGGIGPVRAMIDNILNEDTYGLSDLWRDDYEFYPRMLESFTNAVRSGRNLNSEINEAADMIDMPERLARFQDAIQNFTPMQRELLVREIDNYAESNINQLAENLNPDNPTLGLQEIEDEHYGTMAYLRQIETRRRGEDFVPQDRAEPAVPTPRDIAERNVPETQAFREQTINSLAEVINDEVRTFSEMTPLGLENYIESVTDNPNNLTGSISNLTNEYQQLENIAEYLVSRARSFLPAQENQLVPEYIRGVITRELNEMMMLGELNRAGSVLNRIFEGDGAFGTLTTDEQRTAASDFFNSTLRGLLNDPDYRPAGGEIIPARPVAGNGPEAYRDFYTNEITGSRRAFDEVMQAERMTPGAINEAIRRTDGDARYDAEVQRFYNVDSPAGISQLNNALRQYMENNGFDIEAPAAANPIDELERRYGEAPRAPIDIVTDGLNRPITQFERDYSEEVQDAYRNVLSEILPATTPANLQEAMSHMMYIHDMIESGEHEPGEFNLTSGREMNDLSDLLERHYEVYRQFENLLDGLNDQPPQGRKRGGFIKKMNSGGVPPSSDVARTPAKQNPNPTDYINKKPADPGFAEELKYQIEQRQKSSSKPSGGGGNLTDVEMKNRLGSRNPTYNAGGKVSIDQMRYELLRK